jgi:hypothetical protein
MVIGFDIINLNWFVQTSDYIKLLLLSYSEPLLKMSPVKKFSYQRHNFILYFQNYPND